jgi:AraC-like DNA-binding protein
VLFRSRQVIEIKIINNLGSGDLSAGFVAARLGVTSRYVHLLLDETGKSFSHHVLERRLERAAALLRDPQWHYRKIVDIAAEAGFTESVVFQPGLPGSVWRNPVGYPRGRDRRHDTSRLVLFV